MAPTKRARPSFSPPRPRKSATTKSTSGTNAPAKSKLQSKSKTTTNKGASNSKPKTGSKVTTTNPRRRSKLVSPTPSASDSLENGSDNEAESMAIDEEDHDENDSNDSGEDTSRIPNQNSESPEPDYILAEVTHEPPSSLNPPIPLGLVHRILHSHFSNPEKTKISTDAKEIVGKYIEVFVREAIMRCAYEKNGELGSDNKGDPAGDAGGWLELEDLEKVAVQLCLDF